MGRQPQAGDTLGRYVLEEELGRGGMAVVYRATDPTLEREVAVKVLHGHLDDIEHARRFLREARAAARLEHDSILKIHDYGGGADKDDVAAYIVAELIRGPSLQGYIARRGVLLPEVAAMVVLRLAEALSCAHDKGIVHRDVKPDNVMIAEGGRVVLTDFGIARVLEGDSVTRTGALLGSPAYMSPEQARGEPVDARSDLFALGTVLYKLCTGKLPFTAPDPLATVLRIIKGAFTPPLALNPRIGSALERVILKLLQQKREDRYQSAAELAKVLRELLADVGIDDPEAALARYFDSPGDYNRELVGHVITRSIERARTARERGEHAAALSYCDRVLAFEPQNTDALALIETLSSRRGQRRSLLYGAVALVLAGGVAGAVVLARGGGSDHGSARVGSAGSALASG
ncbi:MAG: protein kinase, partial [Myxococcales bacterium]|nr:protein kinase [Myxococcales bacterium]